MPKKRKENTKVVFVKLACPVCGKPYEGIPGVVWHYCAKKRDNVLFKPVEPKESTTESPV